MVSQTSAAASAQNQKLQHKPKKRARLPPNHRITKRPLLRPAIPSPYAGSTHPKTVYISTRTPFISAVKRVRTLLQHIEKRGIQSALARSKPSAKNGGGGGGGDAIAAAANARIEAGAEGREEVTIKATGKAIEKALNLALFFQGQGDVLVRLRTGTVRGIDDVEVLGGEDREGNGGEESNGEKEVQEQGEDDGEMMESRIREISVLEVGISLRA